MRFRLRRARGGSTTAQRVAALRAGLDGLGHVVNGPTLVPIDLARDSVAERLAVAGQSDKRPTLFICEGLLVYLGLTDIAELLSGLASRATEDSELAASLAVHPFGMQSEAVVKVVNTARGRS